MVDAIRRLHKRAPFVRLVAGIGDEPHSENTAFPKNSVKLYVLLYLRRVRGSRTPNIAFPRRNKVGPASVLRAILVETP